MKRIAHNILPALGLILSLIIAMSVWLQNQPGDLWARRWLLIIIPVLSGIALLINQRQAWQDVAFGIAVTYFAAPLIAARIESCLLPIEGAIPCFADVNKVRALADQLGHHIYYPGLIVLHVIGVIVTWWYVRHKGGVDASGHPSTT